MNPAFRIGSLGFALIAVCYGFARFAFGLFLPQIGEDIELSSTLAGVMSGGAFALYCIAILCSAHLSERVGPRPIAVAAALIAAGGMFGIALSTSPWLLAVSVMFAGISTGLASPPMADAVAQSVAPQQQNLTNTAINAGTSAGVVLSGIMALFIGSDWRMVFIIFTVAALGIAVGAVAQLPARQKDFRGSATANQSKTTTFGLPPFHTNLKHLVAAAFLMGASSTALWSFGGAIAQQRLGWLAEDVGMLWTLIGAAGVLGAIAGWLTARLGVNRVHWLSLIALSGSILMVGLSYTSVGLTLTGGILFGAAYVMLTGVYLVWGTMALPDRPGVGVTIGFLAISLGQTFGAPLFGLLMEHGSLQAAVITYAILGCAAGGFSYPTSCLRPRLAKI